MQLLQTTSRAASLALLLLPATAHAQSDATNQNITLRFFPTSQQDSCDFSNTRGALTFTTSSIPVISHCFDFAQLFRGNATQGFVNQTWNQGSGVWGEAGIHWQLFNVDTFDSQANYSSVLYRQHITDANKDENKPGHHADRRVTLYGAKGCRESDGTSDKLLPWYGFDCWSEDKGSCGTLPYGVASFSIQPQQKTTQGTCWVFAERGAAVRVWSSSQAVMGAFVSASVAFWLAL